MVIIPLAFGLVFYPLLDTGIQTRMLVIAIVLVFVCAVGMLILYPGLDILAQWLKRYSSSESKMLNSLQSFVSQFSESVKRSLTRQTIVRIFLLTVGIRLCKYSSIALLFNGIAVVGFPELSGVDPGAIVIGLLASEAGASLPIPTFMSFGTYEAGGLAAFAMLGLPTAAAGLVLFALHIATQLVDYTFGAVAFVLFLLMTGTTLSTIGSIEGRRRDGIDGE